MSSYVVTINYQLFVYTPLHIFWKHYLNATMLLQPKSQIKGRKIITGICLLWPLLLTRRQKQIPIASLCASTAKNNDFCTSHIILFLNLRDTGFRDNRIIFPLLGEFGHWQTKQWPAVYDPSHSQRASVLHQIVQRVGHKHSRMWPVCFSFFH